MTHATAPHIVVLGGGSAGWITACLLHHRWRDRGGRVTVVESPDIGIIGVGEGSTPQLKAMFDHLGIDEAEWMNACDATYKLGIRFSGWSERDGHDSYFHPFPCPVDLHSEPAFLDACALARRGFAVDAHPDGYFLPALLADEGRSPQPEATFPFPATYGYHFDAYKLGAFLSDWAQQRGVEHRPLKVERVELDAEGNVAALACEGGERVGGDLFVDCSGFRALIAEDALGGTFLPFSQNLFCDRAVVCPSGPVTPFRPQTDAIAMSGGWRWCIPLQSRTGNGYVYSSRHIDDDAAAAELLGSLGLADSDTQPRFLRMKVGRMEKSWQGNCLAAGLAQGFIEPLEATALHIVIATALDFAQAFEEGGFTALHRDTFNRRTAQRYDAIRDYIVAHYRLNQRSDTAFWKENARNSDLSNELKAMMTAWFTHADMKAANRDQYPLQAYSDASWHCLFAGYGTFPPPTKVRPLPEAMARPDNAAITRMLGACAQNFPPLHTG